MKHMTDLSSYEIQLSREFKTKTKDNKRIIKLLGREQTENGMTKYGKRRKNKT